jgi:hypothetical protein
MAGPPKACAECHGAELATAPPGHTDCRTCHEPHGGRMIAAAARCEQCHAPQAKGNHAGIRNGCNACHRPHGPDGPATPPTCTSCHAPARLPNLHKIAQHGTCGSCHTSHETAPREDRRTCAASGCHATAEGKPIAQHQPEAKSCVGCHPFRAGPTL